MNLQPRLIVGLGNPGPQYAETRHNVGFMVVDALLAAHPRPVEGQHLANSTIWKLRIAGRPALLQKPLTYMNCSGDAVSLMCRKTNILPAEVLVVYDDLDLPLGRLRLRLNGSSGGQRGLESIIAAMGTQAIPRLRVGIGPATSTPAEFVLAPFTDPEKNILDKVVTTSRDAVTAAIRRGLKPAMNHFNSTNYQNLEAPEESNP